MIQTLAIPHVQTAMAIGNAAKNANSFELVATRGAMTNGICSNPFLVDHMLARAQGEQIMYQAGL